MSYVPMSPCPNVRMSRCPNVPIEVQEEQSAQKRKLKKQLEKDALADLKEEKEFQAKSSEQLLKEKTYV